MATKVRDDLGYPRGVIAEEGEGKTLYDRKGVVRARFDGTNTVDEEGNVLGEGNILKDIDLSPETKKKPFFLVNGRFRKRVFEVIESATENDRLSNVYDIFMMILILVSMVSLCFKEEILAFQIIEIVAWVVFVIDYLLRLYTADYKLKKGVASFFLYPFTLMAIIDMLSILTAIPFVPNALRVLKVFRLIRTLRVLRLIKAVRYSKSIRILKNVFLEQRKPLLTIVIIAVGYIFVSAIIVFNVEPETFPNFFDAVYWATISLTTVGYGDIYPVSAAGRVVTMLSSIFGIGIIALPSGIITAGFLKELSRGKANGKEEESEEE